MRGLWHAATGWIDVAARFGLHERPLFGPIHAVAGWVDTAPFFATDHFGESSFPPDMVEEEIQRAEFTTAWGVRGLSLARLRLRPTVRPGPRPARGGRPCDG